MSRFSSSDDKRPDVAATPLQLDMDRTADADINRRSGASLVVSRRLFISEIEIRRFGPFESLNLSLQPGLNVVIGPNESGKTQLTGAILFGLFGGRRAGVKLNAGAETSSRVEIVLSDSSVEERVVSETWGRATRRAGVGRFCAAVEAVGSLFLRSVPDFDPMQTPSLGAAVELLSSFDPGGPWREVGGHLAHGQLGVHVLQALSNTQRILLTLALEATMADARTFSVPVLLDGIARSLEMARNPIVSRLVHEIARRKQILLCLVDDPPAGLVEHVIVRLPAGERRTAPSAASFGLRMNHSMRRRSQSTLMGASPRSPDPAPAVGARQRSRSQQSAPMVYLSYSQTDAVWRDKVVTQLGVLKQVGVLEMWERAQVGVGSESRTEVFRVIDRATVAVLLITPDYLASDFIQEVELPRLLERRQKGGLRVVPVLVRSCDWQAVGWLRNMRVLPRHDRFIASGGEHEVDAELTSVARELRELLNDPALSGAAPSSPSMGELAPQFLNEEIRRLSEQLEAARARKLALKSRGFSTAEVDGEILNLRRQIREGGQLRAGDALGEGRYLLLEKIGRGGFAVVWKAHDRERDELVAIKVLHADVASDQTRRERFFRGARAMAELQHDAVVRVLEPHGEDGGYHYFVMELVEGPNLHEAVLAKQLAKDDVLPLILRAAAALAEAHAKGMVHRDVKPANILLGRAGDAKLTDFDLVQAADTTGGTRTGALGTFIYAAPELLDHPQNADARADVYGLGMTTLFALYGRELPRSAFGASETAKLVDGLSHHPRSLRDILRRAVAWDANARLRSIAEFCSALRLPMLPRDDLPGHHDLGTSAGSVSERTDALPARELTRKEVRVSIVTWVKLALDEAYAEIPGTDAERDGVIRTAFGRLTHGYRSDAAIDYRDPAIRFAYVYSYVTANANLVFQQIQQQTSLRNLFDLPELGVTCLGGGPGSDLLGLLKYMAAANKRPTLICNICDREPSWSDTWNNVSAKAIPGFSISVSYLNHDAMDAATWATTGYLRSILFTAVYFLSDLVGQREKAEPYLWNVMTRARHGSLFLFVDRDEPSIARWLEELTVGQSFVCVDEGRALARMPSDEQRSVLDEYQERVGASTRLTAKILYRVYLKP